MRYFSFILIIIVAVACQNTPQQSAQHQAEKAMASTGNFGTGVNHDEAVAADMIKDLFISGDTVTAKVFGHISASCKHSGCWMDLDLGNGDALHVTFKDESFTIPLDAAGKNAIAEGIAIRELIPVEKLKNFAREDGKSEEEIAAITEPVYAYEFIANGVLIEE